jgi:hypothetical protein
MTLTTPGLTGTDFATESGHWYEPDGTPRYTIVGANGKERPTTLADARKLRLVPSYSSVAKLEAAPAIEAYKVKQALLSAITLPRESGESDDSFMARALIDSREHAKKASERGTLLHGEMERALIRGTSEGEFAAYTAPVMEWLEANFAGYTWGPERSFALKLEEGAFGGKGDLCGVNGDNAVVIDYKFKAAIKDQRLGYDNHAMQLAAYREGFRLPTARGINLFIDSETPGIVKPVEWSEEDLRTGWSAFKLLLQLWYLRKGL